MEDKGPGEVSGVNMYSLASPTHPILSPLFQPYASAPSYGKESAPPVPIWKGHSFNTISGREVEKFSGKDSGKGDSDFNDSDSDISGEALKKDLITHMQNGMDSALDGGADLLPAMTSLKILPRRKKKNRLVIW